MYLANQVIMARSASNTAAASPTSTDDSRIKAMESLTKALTACVVVIFLLLLAFSIVLFCISRKKRAAQKADEEQAIGLKVRISQPSSSSSSSNTRRQVQSYANNNQAANERRVGNFPDAYWSHEDYLDAFQGQGPRVPARSYQAAGGPSSSHSGRRERQAQASGTPSRTFTRQQTFGRDYSSGGRESRFGGDTHQSHNSNQNVNYGRRGNRFAHGN